MNPTQHRSVRFTDEQWADFGAEAAPLGGRGSVLRRLVALYLTDKTIRNRVAAHGDDLARNSTVLAAARPQ